MYREAVPALLKMFSDLGIAATFFVVGADAQIPWKRKILEKVLDEGHEVANHSFNHALQMGQFGRQQVENEILDCQKTLSETLQVQARGFRAPGYSYSPQVLEVLEHNGFWYDASLLPTRWGSVLRWIARRISTTPNSPVPQFDAGAGGHKTTRPFWATEAGQGVLHEKLACESRPLVEVPVSVTPRLRFPMHGGIGFLLGKRYVTEAIKAIRRSRHFLNYVIHGMDLVDGQRWPVTSGWKQRWLFGGTGEIRLKFFTDVCSHIREHFEIVRTDRWVEQMRKGA
ncbi:MAG: polysaccharide deacetylase family protein [Candidatus Sumerlaeia bacterium]|nr:polysaccharide deacetylase family protein [Candidatus Sumerlaeia bacterium]